MKKILLIIALILGVVSSYAQNQQVEKHVGDIPGGYNYWLAHPLDTETPKPMVVFLHGSSLRGHDLDRAKRYGSINAVMNGREIDAYVVGPQLPSGSWDPVKIKEVIDYVAEHNLVDKNKIYVIGLSLGGAGTLNFTAQYPEVVAAAVAVASGGTSRDMGPIKDVPMWLIHGLADTNVGIYKSDRVANSIKASDPKAPRLVYDRVPGMNHSKPARLFQTAELYDWLFLHSLDEEGRPIHKTFKVDNELLEHAYDGLTVNRK